MTKLASAALL